MNRYDAESLRCEMKENGELIRFVYHRGELLYERSGESQTSYYLGAGIEARQSGEKVHYYHQDEQLSTALITDSTGNIQNHYQYDAFGQELGKAEKMPNRIRYTGQQYDVQTEQYYLRARYYNPVLGRFMQEDPYLNDGLNLYAYCNNNPVTYYDPSGYQGGAVVDCPPGAQFGGDGVEGGSGARENSSRVANIGENGKKLDYLFGKATGSKHNLERSVQMKNELAHIGIHDTTDSRNLLGNYLNDVLNDSTNITGTELRSYVAKELPGTPTINYTATTKESFFMGPGGGVVFETVWDGDRLLTIIIKGGH